jgi:hypothetical protein
MTNLEKLIKNTSKLLEDKFTKILYTQTNGLTKIDDHIKKEAFESWKHLLAKNNIHIIFDQRENKNITCECFLLDIINKKQNILKDKIVLKLLLDNSYISQNEEYKYLNIIYAITDKENAKKLVSLSSFEN